MGNLLFLLGLSAVLVHEMDAVKRAEWRILLGFLHLSDDVGYLTFTALHVPLYLAIFWFLFDVSPAHMAFNILVVRCLDAFFIIHMGLHWLLHKHRHYQFNSLFSKCLIALPGACGALDLMLRN